MARAVCHYLLYAPALSSRLLLHSVICCLFSLPRLPGMGSDAYMLASRGFRVSLLERNPVIFALLRDGLEQASQVH